MRKTTNYELNKPEETDQYNIEHFNENTDVIDTAMKGIRDDLTTEENASLKKANNLSDLINKSSAMDNMSDAFNSATNANVNADDSFVLGKKNYWYKISFSNIWNYISNKISNVLGLSTNGYNGNAATATKATNDESGNNIKSSYASLLSVNNNITLQLKNKNNAILSEITQDDGVSFYICETPGKEHIKVCNLVKGHGIGAGGTFFIYFKCLNYDSSAVISFSDMLNTNYIIGQSKSTSTGIITNVYAKAFGCGLYQAYRSGNNIIIKSCDGYARAVGYYSTALEDRDWENDLVSNLYISPETGFASGGDTNTTPSPITENKNFFCYFPRMKVSKATYRQAYGAISNYNTMHYNGSVVSNNGTVITAGLKVLKWDVDASNFNNNFHIWDFDEISQTEFINAINRLSVDESIPQDNDFFISQYSGGETTTTTYHRRKFSTLWSWIANKIIDTIQTDLRNLAKEIWFTPHYKTEYVWLTKDSNNDWVGTIYNYGLCFISVRPTSGYTKFSIMNTGLIFLANRSSGTYWNKIVTIIDGKETTGYYVNDNIKVTVSYDNKLNVVVNVTNFSGQRVSWVDKLAIVYI